MILSRESVDAIAVTPPVTVAVTSMMGVDWNTLALAAAFFYSCIMIVLAIWSRVIQPLRKWFRHKRYARDYARRR